MAETSDSKSAFVTGATGLVGKALVAELCRQGWATVAHVRPDSRDLVRWHGLFEGMGAQLSTAAWQPDDMRSELAQRHPTHVFCCIGTTRTRMGRDGAAANSYEAVDYALPKLLAKACVATPSVERLVYLSSAGVAEHAAGAYLRWRWKAEQAVVTSGVAYTLARPSVILGPRDEARPLETWAGAVIDGGLGLVGVLGGGKLRDRYRSTNDVTLAKALVRLAADPEARNRTVESEGLR